jgi:hypothetical protein
MSDFDMEVFPSYTPMAMVALMIEHPEYSHEQFAWHFGRQASWTSSVLASEVFQLALAPYKDQIADPALTATMEERFRALAMRSVVVLQEKLNSGNVDDSVVLQAAGLGIKALGMGNSQAAPVAAIAGPTSSSETVAERLLAAMDRRDAQRTINVTAHEVQDV